MDDNAEEAWRAGMAAGRAGRDLTTNPHPTGSELALDWAGGWHEGHHTRNLRKPDTPRPSH